MDFQCEWCGTVLENGGSFLEYQGMDFCCDECATDYIKSDTELWEDDRLMKIQCEWCGIAMEDGDSFLEYQGIDFCCDECATEYIMSETELLEKVVGEDDRL